jgi:hypothetical protein
MSSERAKCPQCNLPLIKLDAYGERLSGCVGCNLWQDVTTGKSRRLDEEDLIALRGMVWRWTRAAQFDETRMD